MATIPDSPETEPEPQRTFSQRMLDGIERAGNKVPHPVMIFIYLIGIVIVVSAILSAFGLEVTEERLQPGLTATEERWVGGSTRPITQAEFEDYGIQIEYVLVEEDVAVRSLLSIDGVRFMLTSFVNNFAGFSVVAVIIVAMIGVGVAEQAGLMAALIRALVSAAPRQLLTFVIVFIGIISSVATDAGYLILVPLGAAAFLSVGRHPLAGIAAAFGGVSGVFAVNILIAPMDALITEMTNEAIAVVDPDATITITANLYFGIISTVLLAIVVTMVTERVIEPRLGTYDPAEATEVETGQEMPVPDDAPEVDASHTNDGLRYSLFGLLGAIAVIALLTLPSGAPLRDPVDGSIIGNTPFMDSLIFLITLIFLVCGIAYGIGAGTIASSTDVINGVTKTFAGLAGLIFMLLVISQFIAFFNYTNMPRVIAGGLANALGQADVRPTILLIGFILVIALLNILIPNVVPKWAIFAPVFVPLFSELGIAPQTVLAAYRVGDSPTNVITPLMVYLPFILLVAQRYQKSAGLGTIISLMLPYSAIILIVWTALFIAWFLLGIPLGPGYPVDVS
jgi:aminobenzoyl-glutamate transport protein